MQGCNLLQAALASVSCWMKPSTSFFHFTMNRMLKLNFVRSVRYFSTKKPPGAEELSVSAFPQQLPSFSSPFSLDKLYPKSSLDAFTPPPDVPSGPQTDQFNGFIPTNKLTITYAGSGGPGGQHMQKSHTKVCISFHLASADWIPESARSKLSALHKNNINKEGIWAIKSDKTRTTTLNLADCLDKLRCYITEAMIKDPEPSIETMEMKRKKAERAAARRLHDKRMRSMRLNMKKVDLD